MSELNPQLPFAVRLLPSRVFFGWYLVAASFLYLMLTVGVSYYALATFLGPLREAHGWTAGSLGWASASFFVVGGLVGALLGRRVDRVGPVIPQAASLPLAAVGVALAGNANAIWQLYVATS